MRFHFKMIYEIKSYYWCFQFNDIVCIFFKIIYKCVCMHDRSRFKTLDLPTTYNRDEYTTETLNQYR